MKPSKGDQIKVIHKEDSFSEDYQNGDIFTVEDTWYGGVQVKTALGVPLALSESEYEPYRETPQAGLPEGEFAGKITVVTGGVRGIGKTICEEFRKAGAVVCILDQEENEYFTGDLAEESVLRAFSGKVIRDYGRVDFLINNAMLTRGGLPDCSYEDFNYVLRVGVAAPYMLTRLFQEHFGENGSVVNISSSRDRMSQPGTESYTAAKGGIHALTHAMAVSLAGRVRVNSISPGWIDTDFKEYQGPDALQQPAGRVGNPLDIANMVLFLCGPRAGFINGENICIDGGMTRQMIYHGDFGWKLEADQG
ncbi:SDR family oxidoreductase [Enterocloster asparagiformis]|uniref:SDR family oxidoreductase n=1 Tax=Enterocloster asparagiformis TaxID=333367 RepID=UPI0004679E58